MLQFFRSMFKSKIGVGVVLAFLVLIALAFASADVANTGGFGGVAGGDRVATVGKSRIATSSLDQAARTALERIKEDNPRLSMQGFLANGGLEKVLDDMVGRTAVAEYGRQHGVVAGDRLVDSEIAQMGAFKGPDGKFSQEIFRQALSQRGISEDMVRQDLAQGLIARQMLMPASLGAVVPDEMAKRYAALLKDRRTGVIAVLPAPLFAPSKPPSDKELADYYNSHKDDFIRPERRVIRYAAFGDEALKSVPKPTETEIAAYYNANKAKYAAQETRRITQLIVPTEAAAKAVAAEVAGGKSLQAAAQAKGLATSDIGPVSKQALSGQASVDVADAAFATSEGQLAPPAKSALGWHVMHIDSVDSRPARLLDQVRDEIATQLTATKRRAALSDMLSNIEDGFDQGGNLADAAKELGVQIEQTEPITADGKVYEKPGEQAPAVLNRVLQTAFAMDEGSPQIAEVDPGKTFVIFDVGDIAPSAAAPLKEITNDVKASYMLDKGFAAAQTAAKKVQAEAKKKGGDLAKAIAALDTRVPPAQTIDMDRTQLAQMGQQVPPPLALFFSMAEGTVKLLPAPQERGWFVVQLKKIVPGKIGEDDQLLGATRNELGELAGNEYVEALRNAISAEIGVKRNPAAIEAVRKQLGGGGS